MRRVRETGISELNEMQRAVLAVRSRSLVLLAPTGSGKTLAFVLAMLKRLGSPGAGIAALVLAPSRELAMQIFDVVRPLVRGYKTMAMYGGHSFSAESDSVKSAVPDILVATPGRLMDHLSRHTVSIAGVTTLVVDEYDKTLELGFRKEVSGILRHIRNPRFTALTSATRLDELPAFVNASDAEIIDVIAPEVKPQITVVDVPSATRDKLDTLAALLRYVAVPSMVFVNHRESVDRMVSALTARGITAMAYHGGMEQRDREMAVAAFRAGAVPVLVATDLAARGLDIAGVDAVVHYHLPVDRQAYMHRNGRTARAGAEGSVYVITGPDEVLPDYIVTQHPLYPPMADDTPVTGAWKMLYINAGKREKISRGDIAGFIIKQCGIPVENVGKIIVGADYSLVAVHPADATAIIEKGRSERLKNKRVRFSTF